SKEQRRAKRRRESPSQRPLSRRAAETPLPQLWSFRVILGLGAASNKANSRRSACHTARELQISTANAGFGYAVPIFTIWRDSDYRFVLAAVIEKYFVALTHFAQIISRGVIANACPGGLPLGEKIRPRIRTRFLFHQPEIFH